MYLVIRVKAVSQIKSPEELLQSFQDETDYLLPNTEAVTVVDTEIIGGSLDPITI